MPRPPKCRRVCALPPSRMFSPEKPDEGMIRMTVDEYETIRLIDWLGSTQEKCAGQMGVARTTAQLIYNEARKKVADALVNGRRLLIEGENYEVCPQGRECRGKRCSRQGCGGRCGGRPIHED